MRERTLVQQAAEQASRAAPAVAALALRGASNASVARAVGASVPLGELPRRGAVAGDSLIARGLAGAAQRRQVARTEAASPLPFAMAGPGSPAFGQTVGGSWRATRYYWDNDVAFFSAHIQLEFWPLLPGVTEGRIALVQTVKTLRSTNGDKAVRTPTYAGGANEQLALPEKSGDHGRAIDQPSKLSTDTLPLYATSGDSAKTLADASEAPGFGSFGSPLGPGSPAVAPATLTDNPDIRREFDTQEWLQTFEVAAIVLDGPLANMYLGSIEWGWCCENRKVRMIPLQVLRQGPPTAQFTEAAKRWNDSKVNGKDTIDLPLTSDTGSLGTVELSKRVLEARQTGAGDARANFELHALEEELRRRNVRIKATAGKKTGDLYGADNLYVKVAGKRPNGDETKDIHANEHVEFLIPLKAFATSTPLTGAVIVELFDEDTVSGDDLLVSLDWTPPAPGKASRSSGDGDYTIDVAYER